MASPPGRPSDDIPDWLGPVQGEPIRFRLTLRQLASLFVAAVLLLSGRESPAEIRFVETRDLEFVYFDPAGAYLVPYATQCFIQGLAAQRQRLGYEPDGKVTVLLQDFADRGNATTIMGAPRNRVFLDIAPVNLAFETFSPGERMITLANHELVHLATSDMANSDDKRYRRWFSGKVAPVVEHPESILYYYLTNPRASSPRWYQEGSAVFLETWMGGGLGRAQGGYDEMMFRAMVRDGTAFYDPLGLVSKGTEVDFQVGANAYLYGTRFMSYLAMVYSPDKLLRWLRRDDESLRSYAADFERVYGKSLERAWQDWIAWEGEFQTRNLASVAEHPLTVPHDLAPRGLGAFSRAYLSEDRRTLYAAVRYPGRVPHLVAISLTDGTVTELAEIEGALPYRVSSLAYDVEGGTLFYTTDNLSHRNLMAFDLRTGQSRMLLEAARIGDLAFNPADRSLWGLRTNNGFAILVRVPYPYREWAPVHVFPYAEVPFDLDVSPDGTLVSTSLAGPDAARSGIQVMQVRVMRTESLLAGDATPWRRFEFGNAVPEGFTFSPDGRYLYGSSYYTGVSNVYRYEVATGKLEAMSNAEVGFFRPLPFDDANLLVLHYTGKGFVPATIPARTTEDLSAITFLGERIATGHPEVQTWSAGSPAGVDYEAQVVGQGRYRPMREVRPEALYPIIEGYKDTVAVGVHGRFSDPVGFDALNASVSYGPDGSLPAGERLHASVDLRHSFWTLGFRWNAADFYDLFGPTKRARKGYSTLVGFEWPFVYEPPETLKFVAKAAYHGEMDTLPAFQNVPSDVHYLLEGDVGLRYANLRSSIGSVDDEAGHSWSAFAHAYHANDETTPSVRAQYDVGFPLPLHHSSIWLRTGIGASSGDRDDSLANFFFGGFGNNYVDSGEVKRYRELLSMPGFEINALPGNSFVKSMVEWNLPPLRFDDLGSPGFHATWARPALFATALVTEPNSDRFREQAYNVGFQVDLKLQVMHRLPMMLSFGYATGFEGGGKGEDEFMLSLKVL